MRASEDQSSPLGVDLNNVHVLQLLQNVTGNGTTALAEMGWTTSVPFASTVYPSEGTNTKTSPQVDFPCHGGCKYVGYEQHTKKNRILQELSKLNSRKDIPALT